nr:lysine-rich arabinogalactan protein 19-like [Aegilops tauschii subsp. strangulata]
MVAPDHLAGVAAGRIRQPRLPPCLLGLPIHSHLLPSPSGLSSSLARSTRPIASVALKPPRPSSSTTACCYSFHRRLFAVACCSCIRLAHPTVPPLRLALAEHACSRSSLPTHDLAFPRAPWPAPRRSHPPAPSSPVQPCHSRRRPPVHWPRSSRLGLHSRCVACADHHARLPAATPQFRPPRPADRGYRLRPPWPSPPALSVDGLAWA